jgi:hypothetical protein
MQLCHSLAATSAVFDDPNLVSAAGLVSVLALDHPYRSHAAAGVVDARRARTWGEGRRSDGGNGARSRLDR